MKTTGNTILITGGGSGIGLGLAEEFKKLGNEVIVAGRSHGKLEMAKSKGLQVLTVDMTNEDSIKKLAADAIRQWPALNMVIHNAGIMVNEKLITNDTSKIAEDTVATNLLGPIRLTNALLPHLLKQKAATIMTVTSGLAYAPLAMTPTYSATKAAIHSYTESLRFQLKGTSVEVKELVPPYVQTSLMGDRQAVDPNAMPLKDFITEVMGILKNSPDAEEILVERVKPQRTSSYQGAEHYKTFFQGMNDRLMTARKAEWDKL
jgi:uncharacterized oxidoreductase